MIFGANKAKFTVAIISYCRVQWVENNVISNSCTKECVFRHTKVLGVWRFNLLLSGKLKCFKESFNIR